MPLDAATLDALLDRYPALAALPADLASALEADALPVHLPVGTVVFRPGQACTGLPLLLEGRVKVSQFGEGGRQLVLYRVEPGQTCVVTSGCLLDASAYAAQGEVEWPTRAVALPAGLFRRLLDGHAPFRALVFGQFSERLQTLMAVVDAVAFHRLDERLAAWLLARGARVAMTHQAIADELGSAREVVTRVLRQFAEDGLLQVSRDGIAVLDREGLAARAGRPAARGAD